MQRAIIGTLIVLTALAAGYFGFVKYQQAIVLETPRLPATAPPERGTLVQEVIANQLRAIPNTTVWGKTSFDDVRLVLNFSSTVSPSELIIGRDHPNGTKILALFPGRGVPLPVNFPDDFQGFDDYGELQEGYYIQLAEHDFDNDDIPEIIVAVGDGMIDLALNIIKYHAPQSEKDAGRLENWTLVGLFSGQEKAVIEGDTVSMPIGSQGLSMDYTWVKSKFIRTN